MKSSLLGIVLLSFLPLAAVTAEDADAQALIKRVVDAQLTSGFIIRAKLTVSDAGSDSRRSAQIRVKCRRDDGGVRLLYQTLWPTAEKGAALYMEKATSRNLTGFFFTPPNKVEPLTAERLGTPYLDSDLNLEDLIEDFWQWPNPKFSGEEVVDREPCRIINLRPPSEAKSSYSLIRAWVSEEKATPFRLVKFDRAGHAAKEFAIQKVMHRDKLWVPVVTLISKPGKAQQTLFEISRGDRDLDIPVADFSLEEIKKDAAKN
jgi:hypothetical protein